MNPRTTNDPNAAASPGEGVGATTLDHLGTASSSTGLHVPGELRTHVSDIPSIPGYEVLNVVAHGGMGYVLRARDTTLKRDAAIKLPLGRLTPESRERFLREARAAAGLRHPNICRVHAADVTADGTPFIAMEFLDGVTLAERLRGEALSPREAAALLATVARAVAAAHEHGIVHRDIKPQNVILLKESGQPVLTDFGLAKELGEGGSDVTQSGQVMGTPSYMAPEQAAGRIESVGPAADVYGLGAVLYQMLVGSPPFTGPVGEVIRKVQTEPPAAPRRRAPHLHRDLETICLKCLEKSPGDRFASAVELADDLERFAKGEPIRAKRAGFARRALWALRRNRGRVAVGAGILVAVAVAAYALDQANRRGSEAKLTDEQASIVDSMPTEDWTVDDLRRLDSLADGLASRDADRGAKTRSRINEGLFDTAQLRLRKPTFDEADQTYGETVIGWLKPRDAALAERLDRDVRSRLKAWVPVFRIEPTLPESLAHWDPFRHPNSAPAQIREGRVVLGAGCGALESDSHLTTAACTGNSELEVTFHTDWEGQDQVGILLHVPSRRPNGGYSLMVKSSLPRNENRPGPNLAETRAAAADFRIQLLRGDVVIRERRLAPELLPAGRLVLLIQRRGDRVQAQVNGQPPMTYVDLFPKSGGVFGVRASAGSGIVRIEGRRQSEAAAPSAVERGDASFEAGDYSAALAFYQNQSVASAGTEAAAQARFKAGLALLQLGRIDDARDRFAELHDEARKPWSLLAGCYRVVALARGGKLPEADRVLERLTVELAAVERGEERDELVGRLPEDVRDEILAAHRRSAGGLGWFRDDPTRAEKLLRVVRAEEALGVHRDTIGWTRLMYIRALRITADPEDAKEALRLLEHWFATEYLPDAPFGTLGPRLAAEYSWIMRERGRFVEALAFLDGRLHATPGVMRPANFSLLLERARVEIAIGKPGDAEATLELFLRDCPEPARHYRWTADACLMLGLLKDLRNDPAGAREAWTRGLVKKPLTDLHREDTAGGIGLFHTVALQLLTDTLKDDELEDLVRDVGVRMEFGKVVLQFLTKQDIRDAANMMRTAIRRTDGREEARQFAFQTPSFREYTRRPLILAGREAARQVAFGGNVTPEQDNIIAKLAQEGMRAFAENRLGLTQMAPIVSKASGRLPVLTFGWKLEKSISDPTLRGPAAWLLGHCLLRKNQPAEAEAHFRLATTDAPAGSPLKKLAEAELTKLKK